MPSSGGASRRARLVTVPHAARIPGLASTARMRVQHLKAGPGSVFASETQSCAKIQRVLVIVIGGPIASGKSALSRAVPHRFEEMLAVRGAVIDLDLVYEMLDAQRRPKDDPATWVLARRTAGRLTPTLLADGLFVVVEGDVVSDRALREFEAESPWRCLGPDRDA
jgi:hypothetical protein